MSTRRPEEISPHKSASIMQGVRFQLPPSTVHTDGFMDNFETFFEKTGRPLAWFIGKVGRALNRVSTEDKDNSGGK